MPQTLDDLAEISKLSQSWSHADLIKILAWNLHTEEGQEYFTAAQVGGCYERLHLDKPAASDLT